MDAIDIASVVLVTGAGGGMVGASAFTVARRGRSGSLRSSTVIARAASYAGLALILLAAARLGLPGIAVLVAILGAIGLLEWSRLFDLPAHHQVGLLVADVVIVVAISRGGVAAADWLVGGLVLVGASWPVIRADTGRAVRDLGLAAAGCALIPVLLVHAVALAIERGDSGIALVLALAVACAASDVAAFVVGRRFGRTPLAPHLSPNKTRAGLVGNGLGALLGMAVFVPAVVPAFGWPFWILLVALVAAGSVWGDLLESAIKREAHVKDAGSWLPGFGGILDRIDSLLVTVALAYWAARLFLPG